MIVTTSGGQEREERVGWVQVEGRGQRAEGRAVSGRGNRAKGGKARAMKWLRWIRWCILLLTVRLMMTDRLLMIDCMTRP